ncbi:response regulator [Rheinheimera mangrovi]|uniref:response regulator n=1 Tax=Rheinheimera mangrovi TaxID=2498451 RepID=UPI000F8EB253|nr:response regulator [Rheinheimera mangrovi]
MVVKLNKDIQILVVDEQPLTQNYLRYALETLGYTSFTYAENSTAAIALCRDKAFDLIICSFNLNGKDGYQLYQELKVRNLFRHCTGFIFISAETDPSLVHSVLELQPDEFMVKPFAIKDLKSRIDRTVQRKNLLRPLYSLMDQKKTDAALKQVEQWLEQGYQPKYATLLLKTKGEILQQAGRWTEGEQFYSSLIHDNNLHWVKLGLARCLIQRERYSEALSLLQPLLQKADLKLATLDLLADIHLHQQMYKKAQTELLQAADMAPRNLLRQQKLMHLSRLTHDYEHQFRAAKDLVRFARFSIYEQPDLYLNLARASVDYALSVDEEEQTSRLSKVANDTLSHMRQLFPDKQKQEQQVVVQARIYYLKDQLEKAKQLLLELDQNMESQGAEDILDKAKALHEVGLLSSSRDLLKALTQDANKLKGADPVFLTYLKQERKERETLPMGPREFNNHAVLMYERGQWQQALEAFIKAFSIMPGNVGIALNLLQSLRSTENIDPSIQTEQLRLQCEVILSKAKLSEEQQKRWQQLQSQQKIAI